MLSTILGLRASELASIRLKDVYSQNGSVLQELHVSRSFLPSKREQIDLLELPKVRMVLADYFEKDLRAIADAEAPLFRSQKGGALKSQVIARYLTNLYRKAGIVGGSSRSGRKTFMQSK